MPSERKSERAESAKPAARKAPARAKATQHHRRGGMLSMDSEQSARMLIFGITAAVLIAAVAFIAVGYYVSVIRPRGRTVLQVEQTQVSYSDMKRRMAYEYYSNITYQDPQTIFNVPAVAYVNLEEELSLIHRPEGSIDILVDDAEVEKRLRTLVGVAENADDQTFSDRFRITLSQSRLTDGEYRRLVRAQVIEEKVRAKLNESTPATVPQAKVEVIAVREREEAQAAIDRINAGEPFGDVAKAVSLDTTAQTDNGLKEFDTEASLPAAYSTFAFAAAVGELSTPLQDPSGAGAFYVVRVAERSEQPLSDAQKSTYQSDQYNTWLETTQTQLTIVDNWSDDIEAQSDALQPLLRALAKKQSDLAAQQTAAANAPTAVPVTPGVETPAATTPGADTTPAATPPGAEATPAGAAPTAAAPAPAPTNGQ